jgi:hypothetical protein
VIPSGALLAILLAAAAPDPAAQGESGEAGAKETQPPPPPVDEQALEPFRIPVEAIAERMVGSASRAVRFDWRKKKVGVAAVASDLVELNNFSSVKLGVSARVPLGGFMVEAGLSWVGTWGSRSTELLALTPYRQVARPSRFQLDANLAYPLAEGVATSRPGFLPATELVFSAVAGLRYLYYPGSLHGLSLREGALALVAPLLGQAEVDNLEAARLPAMEIDRARYGALGGLTLDVYFPPGAFITPRVMIAPPLLSLGSGLGWWWELTFSAGWMF